MLGSSVFTPGTSVASETCYGKGKVMCTSNVAASISWVVPDKG